MKQVITVELEIARQQDAYAFREANGYLALEHFFTDIGFKVVQTSSSVSISAAEAIEFLQNKLRPTTDRRILVARGVDEDNSATEEFAEVPYTELCDDDDTPNIEDGTYYDFQIWS